MRRAQLGTKRYSGELTGVGWAWEEAMWIGEAKDEASAETSSRRPSHFSRTSVTLAGGDAETPLTTTTAFIAVPQRTSLAWRCQHPRGISSSDPRSAAGVDPNLAQDDAEARKSWRRERQSTLKLRRGSTLENVRGLELGKNGEVSGW